MLAGKHTADLRDIVGHPLPPDDEDDLSYIEYVGGEHFTFDEAQFNATGALPPFSRQLHSVPRDMLLNHAHPDDHIIALEECGVVLLLFIFFWRDRYYS